MNTKILCPAVIALGLFGNSAYAEDPPVHSPQRQIVRWPGGWMFLDEPGVIYLVGASPKNGSATVITSSANGVGNKIVVDNGKSSGTTVLQNVRNGVGNSVTVSPNGPVFEPKPDKKPTVPSEKK